MLALTGSFGDLLSNPLCFLPPPAPSHPEKYIASLKLTLFSCRVVGGSLVVVFGAVGSDLGWPLISGSHGMAKLDGGGWYLLVLANKCSVAGSVCGSQCAHLY